MNITRFFIEEELKYVFGIYIVYYITMYTAGNDYFLQRYPDSKNCEQLRSNIAAVLKVNGRILTKHLKNEYHCLTTEDRTRYMFTNRANCEMACEYLNTLLVARELIN